MRQVGNGIGLCAPLALVLAGALVPGEGRAQGFAERVERPCADLFAPTAGLPSGARCFIEFATRTRDEWLDFRARAVICPTDVESCRAATSHIIPTINADTSIIALVGDAEVARGPWSSSLPAGGSPTALGSTGSTLLFETSSRTEDVTAVSETRRIDTAVTRVSGRVGDIEAYNVTVEGAVTDPAALAGLAAARLGVTAAGGPGVIALSPVLIERTETLIDSQVDTRRDVQGETEETVSLVVAVGGNGMTLPFGQVDPVTLVADFGLCTSAGTGGTVGSDGTLPSGCTNTDDELVVPLGLFANILNTNTHTDILETVTTTELWRIFEHWEVVGVLRALGEIHAAVQTGARDLGQRLLRRMGDEAQAPRGFALAAPGATLSTMGGTGVALHGWVEGYALRGNVGATGGTEAERRHARGIAAGLTWVRPDGLTWGVALDHGRGTTDIAAAGESADIRLTQGAVMLGMQRPGGFVAGTLSFGTGRVEATTTLGGPATARYDLRTMGAQVEAGWHLRAGDWRLTPSLGLDWTRVRTGAFSAGGITAAAHDADRTRVFAGLAARRDWVQGDGVLTLDASARIVHVPGGSDRLLPVGFGGAPLAIGAGPEGRTGLDLGLGLAWRQGTTEARIGYTGRFRDSAKDHALTAGLTLRW